MVARALTEGELVALARDGDGDAYASLVRAHQDIAFRTAMLITQDAAEAEEAAQDAFVKAWRALGRFRGQCPLRSYILSITVRNARQHLRAAQRRRAHEARAMKEADVAATAGPDAELQRRELAVRLTRALDALPLAQRAAFILCEVEERSSAEAGEILGEKAGTVRARVFHAKRALRERLAELSPESLSGVLEVES